VILTVAQQRREKRQTDSDSMELREIENWMVQTLDSFVRTLRSVIYLIVTDPAHGLRKLSFSDASGIGSGGLPTIATQRSLLRQHLVPIEEGMRDRRSLRKNGQRILCRTL
jgi:hypothetical protein